MNKTTKPVFQKTLHFPTVCVGVGRGKGCKTLEVTVSLNTELCKDWETLEEKEMYVFSAHARGIGHWGQCLDYLQENAEKYIMPDRKRELFNKICRVCNEYHLNELQCGTKRQKELLPKELWGARNYTEACEHLKCVGAYEDKGFEYGHGWLCKEIPTEVVAEIMSWQNEQDEDRAEIARIRRKCFKSK